MIKAEKLLVLPRVYLGLMFFVPAFAKTFGPEFATLQIEQFVGGYAVTHGYSWYRGFLQGCVMHHVGLFATLVTVGEWYVVMALLFGITTRLAAGIALFMLLNFMAAKGADPWFRSAELHFAVMAVLVMLGAAGRTLGVDQFLHRRYPRVPLW